MLGACGSRITGKGLFRGLGGTGLGAGLGGATGS